MTGHILINNRFSKVFGEFKDGNFAASYEISPDKYKQIVVPNNLTGVYYIPEDKLKEISAYVLEQARKNHDADRQMPRGCDWTNVVLEFRWGEDTFERLSYRFFCERDKIERAKDYLVSMVKEMFNMGFIVMLDNITRLDFPDFLLIECIEFRNFANVYKLDVDFYGGFFVTWSETIFSIDDPF